MTAEDALAALDDLEADAIATALAQVRRIAEFRLWLEMLEDLVKFQGELLLEERKASQ